MKVVRLRAPANVANLRLLEEDQPLPKAGEVLVRMRARSLNPHDDFVVRGVIPVADGRVPLSDGAGQVLACGEGVTELRVGDAVVSMFWPYWHSGDITAATRRDIPGENVGRADQEDMIRAIHVNQLKPVVDRTFGLEQIAAAFEYYQTQSHFGKIGLEI